VDKDGSGTIEFEEFALMMHEEANKEKEKELR
jgi:Ca2+-binding EF-hand superfamily protein